MVCVNKTRNVNSASNFFSVQDIKKYLLHRGSVLKNEPSDLHNFTFQASYITCYSTRMTTELYKHWANITLILHVVLNL